MSLSSHTRTSITILTLGLLLLGTGCRTFQREKNAPPIEEDTPASTAQGTSRAEESWSPLVIRPGSQLNIHVYVSGQREIDVNSIRVSDTGAITLPLIGTIGIAGRPLRTASQIIEALYDNYFVEPQVTMDFIRDEESDAFPWGFVTVLGRVKRQGRVPIPPTRDLTVSSAIQQAGGFDTSARVTAIRVTRKRDDGDTQTFDVNMRNVGRRGRTDEDILLYPNDVVFIPELLF